MSKIEEKKMVRWTDQERALLAHFIRIAIEENGKSNQEALEFAALKLGRSKNACYWQYHNYISKGNYKPIDITKENKNQEFSQTFEEEALIQLRTQLAASQDLVKKLIEERIEIYSQIAAYIARNNWSLLSVLSDTGTLTSEDIQYHNNIIDRIFNYKYSNNE